MDLLVVLEVRTHVQLRAHDVVVDPEKFLGSQYHLFLRISGPGVSCALTEQ